MNKHKFDFGEALSFMKCGLRVINSRGNIFFIEDGKVYCIPGKSYPKGKREEVRVYWDSIINDEWTLFEE